ncbi:MAG: division/cell wall cluster transcriptional repressor MraZ [Candidatus Kapaibacterium sp.]
MSFFKGRETYSVDDKGRLAIPAKMRKSMSPESMETFVVTRGPDEDPCIYAYPLDEWQKVEGQLAGLNQYNDRDRFFLRTLLYWADELVFDKQHRVMLPKALVEFAQIEKTALIIGAMDHLEIWNPEIFESYLTKRQESYAEVAETVMGGRLL